MKFLDNKQIFFDPELHKYRLGQDDYISASTLVKKYAPEFDADGTILARCAAKRGITPEELQKEWDDNRDDAGEYGTRFHAEAEYWVDTGKIRKTEFSDIIKQLKKIKFRGKLRSETIIYSEELKIAGTVDLLDQYGDELNILDYKTNKQLKKTAFYSKETGYSKMLYPINHLMDCNFIHYSLQQEIYGLILEQYGYWVNEKILLYINPKTRKIEEHPIEPLRKEAQDIISHFFGKYTDI